MRHFGRYTTAAVGVAVAALITANPASAAAKGSQVQVCDNGRTETEAVVFIGKDGDGKEHRTELIDLTDSGDFGRCANSRITWGDQVQVDMYKGQGAEAEYIGTEHEWPDLETGNLVVRYLGV